MVIRQLSAKVTSNAMEQRGDGAALERALDALEGSMLAQLLEVLVTFTPPIDGERRASLLAEPARLEELFAVADAGDFARAHRQSVRVVKELCRVAMRHVTAVAARPEDAASFLLLDEALCCLLKPVAKFAERVAEVPELRRDKELVRWLPFALCAASFVACGKLPASDLMASADIAARIFSTGSALAGVEDVESVLAKYVTQVVALSSQGVTKEDWVEPESFSKHVLLWVITRVSFPHLGGDLLGRILALTFPLIDDLRDETQVVGVQILRHIVFNVTPSELRWYSDVLLEVLRTSLTSRKPLALDWLLECLAESLAKVSPPGEVKFYDQFLPRLLTDVSLCNDTPVRTIYIRRLRPFVEHMGAPHSIHLIRYLQPLLKVLIASFDAIDVTLLLEALETLRLTVTGAWPRIPAHTEEILVGTMRVVAYCEMFDDPASTHAPSPEQKEKLLSASEEVLALLYDLDGANVLSMLHTIGAECKGLKSFTDGIASRLTKNTSDRSE